MAALSVYVTWRTSKGDEKFALVRTFGVAFGAIGGTSFRGADLTTANFTGATLKSTRLIQATLIHTCWADAKRLDRARVRGSILSNAAVRELLTSRNGYSKSYVNANLHSANLTGVNLNEANLKQADLGEALLQNADLRGANLSETLAVGTDFTGAALTGACLQAWNIDHTTKLDQVDCQFVFLLEQPNALGSRERRPHDFNKVFEPGDFAKLYQKIMTTVQLLLRDGINPEAFKAAFERLMQENPEITPDAIQAVERKGNDVLVTLTVPEDADKGKIEREWDEVYQARLEAQKSAALLEAANSHKEDIKEITLAVVSNLSGLLSNFTVNAVSESKAMSDSNNPNTSTGSGSFVNAGNLEMTGSTVNLGEISGNVINTINQLQQSSNPEAAQLADLLQQLQSTIEAEPALTPEDKTEALEQVGTLAKAGQNPQDGTLKKLAATAIKILKGTIASLPSATQTVMEVTKLVGAIATLLAL
ncbi:MAG: pentapeptide repeat-containing protein [Leptolyngbyaceae cyanobacterium RM1_406_9]|nr:pentapeptide repeat-containing protein [Leptolyngbyaceae cyanobacterium RM1_406_9]